MYPNGRTRSKKNLPPPPDAPQNHKPGYCSDGAPSSAKHREALPWPQPSGIFVDGTKFDVVAFLRKVQELGIMCSETPDMKYDELEVELQAFSMMLVPRIKVDDTEPTSKFMFRLFDGLNILDSDAWAEYIVEKDGSKWLRMGCLQDDAM